MMSVFTYKNCGVLQRTLVQQRLDGGTIKTIQILITNFSDSYNQPMLL
jgi:hypothetical protein